MMYLDCNSPLVSGAREKHLARAREKTFARFRTVSGLQNLVPAPDAKPQIKFAFPKNENRNT